MKAIGKPSLAAFALIVALANGCSTSDSNVPMATDGPNQVILKVPGMF